MVLLGHVHTHEFMAGGTTDQVGNPWDLGRTAGGSSGGSAAAIAARLTPLSVGSDTLGSVRIPAALTGISSIKPTHGAISLDGALKLAASLDHAGPMARTVADASMLLAAMAAAGPEITPLMAPPAALENLPTMPRPGDQPLAGTRIAVTNRVDPARIDSEVLEGLERAKRAVIELGGEIAELAPGPAPDVADIEVLMQAEMAAHHFPFLDRMDRYRPMVRAQLEASLRNRDVIPYLIAQERRARLTGAWEAWFDAHRVDALLEPTVVLTAHMRGNGYAAESVGGAEDQMTIFTALWNLTGFPVVALPAGLGSSTGLPVGVSIAAPRGREAVVTQIGIDLQSLLGVPTPPDC
jgi:aspartyl-tRNA(Asn)/glutamyl-tRNA(Gln) amidotransferase subunit A